MITQLECNSSTDLPGAPLLPAHKVMILIPQDIEVDQIEIFDTSALYYDLDSPPYPCQVKDTSVEFTYPDPDYYQLIYPFPPKTIYTLEKSGYMMGFNVATLKIFPVQYIPYEERIRFYPHIGFNITFKSSQVEHSHPKRVSELSERFVEDLIKAIVLNPGDVEMYRPPSLSVEKRGKGKLTITSYPSLEGNCVDYVIVTSEALRDSFERLAEYRWQWVGDRMGYIRVLFRNIKFLFLWKFWVGDPEESGPAQILDYQN